MTGHTSLFVATVGALSGYIHFVYIRRRSGARLETVHLVTRLPLILVVAAVLVVGGMLALGANADICWHVPIWLDAHTNTVIWAPVFAVTAYVMSIGTAFAWVDRHAKRIALTCAAAVLLLSLLSLRYRLSPALSLDETGGRTGDGLYLQSTDSSCAAASGANIAKMLNVQTTESRMAHLMGTTGEGTTVGQVIIGMRKLRLVGTKVVKPNVTSLTPPAMLFVDHEATGPESHAIALLETPTGERFILDPLIGKQPIIPRLLEKIWHGKAIEFRLAEQSLGGDSGNRAEDGTVPGAPQG